MRWFFILLAMTAAVKANNFFPKPGERIVFLGDSITAAGLYSAYVEAYTILRYPNHSAEFINAGKSSETVSGLTEPDHPGPRPKAHNRFEKDVAALKPDTIVACYGMNDGIYHPFDENRFDLYKKGIAELIGLAEKTTTARLVLLT